jgi:hypothetical protein
MDFRPTPTLALLIAIGGLTGVSGTLGAQNDAIVAQWRATPIVVDGSITDWPSLTRVGSGPAVAAANDDTVLSLVIASNDRLVREQLATGVIVWMDAGNRRRQTFGLRLEGLAPRPPAGTSGAGAASAAPLESRVSQPIDSFDLLGPAQLQRRLIDDAAQVGIRLASGVDDGMVAYEIELPLTRSNGTPHALTAAPGTTIGVGIETPAEPRVTRERSRLADPWNTNPWIHNPYGGYFNPPPPPGGGNRAPEPVEFRPLRLVWTQLKLAAAPAPATTPR